MQLCGSLNILWHCPSLELKWKLTVSTPVSTAEFSRFAASLSATLITASSWRILNSSAGIPSSPRALSVVKPPKAHLTSLSKMSGSRLVTTPSWLSESLRLFFFVQFFWSRKWQPTPVFLPGKFQELRSLAGYRPWGPQVLDRTEQTCMQ